MELTAEQKAFQKMSPERQVSELMKTHKPNLDTGNKYRKIMPSITIDVYDIIKAYEITNPALQHAIKKLLVAGGRGGGKSWKQDLKEAQWSIDRAIELEK